MTKPVLIVGGGFAGIYTAKHLLKHKIDVHLISEKNYFTFTPLLHEIATGNLSADDIIFEYESFFRSPHFQFTRGIVDRIDTKKKRAYVEDHKYPYHDLVIATGSSSNFFGMKGTEHVLTLKSVEDALHLKKTIIEQAQGTEKHTDITVIGGGPTGVELILELKQLLETIAKRDPELSYTLHLIHAGSTLVPHFGAGVSKYTQRTMKQEGINVLYDTKAQEVTATHVHTTNGSIPSTLTIMTAGVQPRTAYMHDHHTDERGNVHVNDYLQTKGQKHVYALGDIIVQNEVVVPRLAQTAVAQADIAARNIIATRKKRPLKTYTPHVKGTLLSLGHGKGAGTIFGLTIKGFFAWWVWRTIYLFKTPGLINKLRVAFSWTVALFRGKNVTEI